MAAFRAAFATTIASSTSICGVAAGIAASSALGAIEAVVGTAALTALAGTVGKRIRTEYVAHDAQGIVSVAVWAGAAGSRQKARRNGGQREGEAASGDDAGSHGGVASAFTVMTS